ncbi:hypothetical protein AgCh_006609 [Apium graveolens]
MEQGRGSISSQGSTPATSMLPPRPGSTFNTEEGISFSYLLKMSILFEIGSGMWWCDKGIQGDSDNYDGTANSHDHYDYAPAESEDDDDDDGGYDYAPAA